MGVGAEQGLGAALCRKFAAQGHHVLVAGRSSANAVKTLYARQGSGEAIVVGATNEADAVHLFERADSQGPRFAPVALAVFNVGNNR